MVLQLQIGDCKIGIKVDVQFLIATYHLKHAIVTINVVKVIAEWQPEYALIKML